MSLALAMLTEPVEPRKDALHQENIGAAIESSHSPPLQFDDQFPQQRAFAHSASPDVSSDDRGRNGDDEGAGIFPGAMDHARQMVEALTLIELQRAAPLAPAATPSEGAVDSASNVEFDIVKSAGRSLSRPLVPLFDQNPHILSGARQVPSAMGRAQVVTFASLAASAATSASREAPVALTVLALANHLPPAVAHPLPLDPDSGAFSSVAGAVSTSNRANGVDFVNATAASDNTREEPIKWTAASLAAYLPAAAAQALPSNVSGVSATGQGGAETAPPSTVSVHAPDGPAKLLTFQLEPEALGAVTVKMRLVNTRVHIQIAVNSTSVLSLLSNARDKLAEAISASGHSIEGIAIHVSPGPAPSDSLHNGAQPSDQFAAPQNRQGGGGSSSANDGMANDRGSEAFPRSPKKSHAMEDGAAGNLRDALGPGVYI